jgi:mannose-6-phosphate isomerase-like protein (cupin superfamily)
MPFTLRNLREDLADVGSNFDGAPDLEFRLASRALELEQSGLSYQRIPPDYRFPYGHTHKEQEEVFVVVGGSGRMKLDDEIVEVKRWDVVRVPPGTWRGYEAGPEGLEILVFGAPNLGENPRDDVEGQRDWWADQPNKFPRRGALRGAWVRGSSSRRWSSSCSLWRRAWRALPPTRRLPDRRRPGR